MFTFNKIQTLFVPTTYIKQLKKGFLAKWIVISLTSYKTELHNVRKMVEFTLSAIRFCPNLAQAITKGSNMVIISKWVTTKCLNTEQKHSWPTTLYNDNVYSKEASKI